MACLLLSSNMAPFCSQPRNCDLRFSLGRGKEICVFSWGQFIGSRYYCYLYYCFWRYFFFHLMYDMGQQLGARAFRRANLFLFSVEIFPFFFRSWQIFLVSASAIFSIGLTIFASFPTWKNTTRGERVRKQIGGLFERLFGLISESGFLVSTYGAVKHQVLNNSSYRALS